MSAYEELVERCSILETGVWHWNGMKTRERERIARAVLAEVLRTLETVTPGVADVDTKGLDVFASLAKIRDEKLKPFETTANSLVKMDPDEDEVGHRRRVQCALADLAETSWLAMLRASPLSPK